MTSISSGKPAQLHHQLTTQNDEAKAGESRGTASSVPVVTPGKDEIQRTGVLADQQNTIGGQAVQFNTEVVQPGQGVGSLLAVLRKPDSLQHAVSKAAQQRLEGSNVVISEMKPRSEDRDLRAEYGALHAEADKRDQGLLVTDQFRFGDGDVGTFALMMPEKARTEGGGMWQTQIDGHAFSQRTLSSFYDMGSAIVGDGKNLDQEAGLVFATDFARAAEQMYRGDYASAQKNLEQLLQQEGGSTSREIDAMHMLALAKTRQGLDGSSELKAAHEISEYDATTVKLLMLNDLERISQNPPAEEKQQLRENLAATYEAKKFLLNPEDPFVVSLRQYLAD